MGLEIRLFGEPEILRDGKAVALGAALPTLALFILWRHRGGVDAETLAGALKPVSEAETDRTSFLKKHKKTLRDRLGLTLPETLKLTALGGAVLEQAWVDVVCFDQKIGSGDRRDVDEALALRSRGPLLAGLQAPPVLAAEREAKYLAALRKLFVETSRSQPQEALRLLELQMDCDGLPEDEAERLRGARLTLEEEIFRSKMPDEDGKTTRRGPLLFLPSFPTALIGREAESDAVEARLSAPGLVTLTGPAGIGKTRLAVAAAGRLRESFPGGAGFADFAAASDAEQITAQISAVLGLMEEKERSRRETLLLFLADKALLLVWDNCEHLTDACADLAAEVLRRCPGVRILATSREALHVYGERLFSLPVLPEDSAVRLFGERAEAASPGFRITEQNRAAVEKICRDLDGLPLALELAAALLPVRTVSEIASSLDKRFALLVDGPRGGGSPRHASLEAAFDLSYDLLSPPEQAVFRTLGVFAGSFSREAAEAVFTAPDTAALLTRLVRKSLVIAEENSDEMRFRLLVSLRQYAEDKLRAQGEVEGIRCRHREHFLALAEEAKPHLRGLEQKRWLDRLEIEHDNFRAVLASYQELSFQKGPVEEKGNWVKLAGLLWVFWWLRGHLNEGRFHLSAALEGAGEVPLAVRPRAHEGLGNLAYFLGDLKTAHVQLERGLEICREIGDDYGAGSILNSLGALDLGRQKMDEAEARFEQALCLYRKLGNTRAVAVSLSNLGAILIEKREFVRARLLFEESSAIFRDLDDVLNVAQTHYLLGNLSVEERCFSAAHQHFAENLKLLHSLKDEWRTAHTFEALMTFAIQQGDHARAGCLWGTAEALRERLSSPLPADILARYQEPISVAKDAIGEDAYASAVTAGHMMTWEQAVAFALQETTA